MLISKRNIIVLFTWLFILTKACSPAEKLNVLTFFFDGVPVMEEDAITVPDSTDLAIVTDTINVSRNNPILAYIYHEPYSSKACNSCHDRNSVGKLVKAEPDLCYLCHTNFSETYTQLHGPVNAGYCSACHDPHLSSYEKLLILEGNELCFQCHMKIDVDEVREHNDTGEALCITCHNPHGSNKQSRKAIPIGR